MEGPKPDKKPYVADLIRRYLCDQLSDAETRELENWIEDDIVNRQFFLQLGSLYAADEKEAKKQKP